MVTIFGAPKRKKMKEEAFQQNYEKYYPILYKQLYYLVGSNSLAEDLTQEVFIKYYNTQEEAIEYLGAWLSKVATNLALNHIRGEKRRLLREENTLLEVNEIFSTEEEILRKEEVKKVRWVLKQLHENQRICLLLKFSGYSYEEIHQITSIPKNNISQHIARGKQKFQEIYAKEGEVYVLRRGAPSTGY